MVSKKFRIRLVLKVVSIATVLFLAMVFWNNEQRILAGLTILTAVAFVIRLIYYVESTNRKLTLFLESIEYSDFTTKFSVDDSMGKGFAELNATFNKILAKFKKERAEKEAHAHYLNTVVQHVRIGLLSFDENGKIKLFNNEAARIIGFDLIQNINELEKSHPEFYTAIKILKSGSKTLIQLEISEKQQQLSITAIEMRLKGKPFKLITVQNIRPELQQKELDAWQNLAKVLRHEIMNSLTPISSYAETLNEIIEDEFRKQAETIDITGQEAIDISNALKTIASRSKGLMDFVGAYRNFTSIPEPNFSKVIVEALIQKVVLLFKEEIEGKRIKLEIEINPINLEIYADQQLIEMVLINLLKNAVEVVENVKEPMINIKAEEMKGHQVIRVIDNGGGIGQDVLDKIFIPFYTTKKGGSGIGLSLSQQILHMHDGVLKVAVNNEKSETEFIIQL